MKAPFRLLRSVFARRRPAGASFAETLARAVHDAQPITLRLSTVERSVGSRFAGPQARANQED
jgi:hypothetical protein